MNKKIGKILMLLGAALIAAAVVLAIFNYTEDKSAGKASENILPELSAAAEENSDGENEFIIIDGNEYIGYISVPSLGIDLPVMAEWDYDKLKIAPCRYYGSAKTDDLIIAGHNYTSHFGKLTGIDIGASVYFTDAADRKYEYTVADIESLGGYDTEKMIISDYDLTLYTCDYSGNNRITVRCTRLDKQQN